jgi:hypothetical protein
MHSKSKKCEKFGLSEREWYTRLMKRFVIIFLLLCSIPTWISAANITVPSVDKVPAWATPTSNPNVFQLNADTYTVKAASTGSPSWSAWWQFVEVETTGKVDNILDDGSWNFQEKVRAGNFTFDDFPKIIVNMIEFLLGIAGTISVVMIVYGALQMQLNSGILGKSDDKWRKIIIWWIVGFVIAISSWFIMTKFIEILSNQL